MTEPYLLSPVAQICAIAATYLLAAAISAHILLHKRSPRAAAAWIALVWLAPIWGSVAYMLLGVNRVQRRATRLQVVGPHTADLLAAHRSAPPPSTPEPLPGIRPFLDSVTPLPLMQGNLVTLLNSGEEAYPRMIAEIDQAQRTVALQTFIFDLDAIGQQFVDAIARAVQRGVNVKILLDGVGHAAFSHPRPYRALKATGACVERFLWTIDPRRMTLINLRNHRKVLVVDGRIAFTGGMNIRGAFVRSKRHPLAERDLHCCVTGPVVRELMTSFLVDWAYTTHEVLSGTAWFPRLDPTGAHIARVVPDGPDENHGDAEMSLVAGLSCAQHTVLIHTPYFLPTNALETALGAAARRGVNVDILLPAATNQPLVSAAMRQALPRVLEHGVNVWLCPGPFDHSKAMVVDDKWCLLGSANWDPRSLRLNFEIQLEVWSRAIAQQLSRKLHAQRDLAHPVTITALQERPLLRRLVDSLVHLFSPYL